MRTSLILAATLALTGSAFAQFAPMGTGQFCVRGDSGANKGIETCNYQSMAQCEAARGPDDKCFPNAQLRPQAASAVAPRAKAAPNKMKSAATPKAKTGSDKMQSAAGKSKSTTGSGSKN